MPAFYRHLDPMLVSLFHIFLAGKTLEAPFGIPFQRASRHQTKARVANDERKKQNEKKRISMSK